MRRFFEKLWQFFRSGETPRYVLIIGFICSTLAPKAIDAIWDKMFYGEKEHARHVDALLDETLEFRLLATRYVESLIDARSKDADARRLLIENMNKQYATIELIDQRLEREKYVLSERYVSDLVAMRGIVSSNIDAKDMLPFWKAMQMLIEHRNAFMDALDKKIS